VERHEETFTAEFYREISDQHVLHGVQVQAVGRRFDCDDVLFVTDDPARPVVIVHLTWIGQTENDPRWPSTGIYRGWDDPKLLAELSE
jgi:hypothetical protein